MRLRGFMIGYVIALVTLALLNAGLAQAAPNCSIMAEYGGADNFVLFPPNKIDDDCGNVPLNPSDQRFIDFVSTKGPMSALVVGVQEINSELIHEFFDRDNSFFDFWHRENSDADVDFFSGADLFPNSCVPFETFADPNFSLSDYYNTNYAGEAKPAPALSRCLAKGMDVGSKAEEEACYQDLDHTLPNGNPNKVGENPMDFLTTDKQQYERLVKFCDDVIKPCHNKNRANVDDQRCFNDQGQTAGKGNTAFEFCQVIPDYEGWKELHKTPEGKALQSKYKAALTTSKALGTVYVFIVWDQDESESTAWRDFSDGAKQGNLFAIARFNVCGAQQTTNNLLDRMRVYLTPEKYETALSELKHFVNAGEAYRNIPDEWRVKYVNADTPFRRAVNMIIDRINAKALGPENTEHLPMQFTGGFSNSNRILDAILGWLKINRDNATAFTEDGEQTKEVYKGWYLMTKELGYQYAIMAKSKNNQLHRYQIGLETKGVMVPLPADKGAGANDNPDGLITSMGCLEGHTDPETGQFVCTKEEQPESLTRIFGFTTRKRFYGGGPAEIALRQRFQWLLPPEKQIKSNCYHDIIEQDSGLLSLLRGLPNSGYDEFRGVTTCPDDIPSTLTGSRSTETLACSYSDAAMEAAMQAAASEWGVPYPLLKAIYYTEGSSVIIDPENYVCGEGVEAGKIAMGPMQFTVGGYNRVTCENERMNVESNADKGICTEDEKLSRCDPRDAFEMAARHLLLAKYSAVNNNCQPPSSKPSWDSVDIYQAAYMYFGTCKDLHDIPAYASMYPPGVTYMDTVCEKINLFGGSCTLQDETKLSFCTF